jgi:putative ABC transport system permease protein
VIRRLLAGSLRRGWGRLAVIALAGTVAAGTVAAAAGLGVRLTAGASASLHAAGPNLLVRPQVGGPERLESADVARVRATPGVEAAVGLVELAAAAELVAGADGDLRVALRREGVGRLPVVGVTAGILEMHPRWDVAGEGVASEGALVGVGALSGGPKGHPTDRGGLPVVGTLTTGEDLDRAVLVPLEALAPLLGADPGVDRIEVRAAAGRLEETARAIEARVAGAEARPLVKVTETEARMVRKLQLLVAGVGAVCLLLALATVGSATLALLEERRREMALFLSLGYTGRWVQGLLTAELALVGLASVAAGALLGEAGAGVLARILLGEAGGFRPSAAGLLAGAAAVTAVIALAAAIVRRRVERLDPAPVLQGR